jgi:hypothetical protein
VSVSDLIKEERIDAMTETGRLALTPERCRSKAAECERRAAEAPSSEGGRQNTELARLWAELADELETRWRPEAILPTNIDLTSGPHCVKCGGPTRLALMEPAGPGHDRRSFCCEGCGELVVVVVPIGGDTRRI